MTVAELQRKLAALDPDLHVHAHVENFMGEVEDVEIDSHHSEPDGPYIVVLS